MRGKGQPQRLTEQGGGGALAGLVRSEPAPAPMSDVSLERLWRRLAADQAGVRLRRRPRWVPRLAPLIAGMLMGVTVGASATLVSVRLLSRPTVVEPPTAPPPPRPKRHVRSAAVSAPAPTPEAPPPPVVTPLAAVPRRPVAAAPPVLPPPSPPEGDDELDSVSSLVARGLRALQPGGDAAVALASFDEALRSPRGGLRTEAERGRVIALVQLRRLGEARRSLASLIERLPADGELALLLAELSVDEPCPVVLASYDRAVALAVRPVAEERALFGRAVVRQRCGDPGGAAADLDVLLARFPAGAHAAEATKMRDRVRPAPAAPSP